MHMLKALRKSDGITLDELASRTGIQKASLSRLENSEDANVTINTLYRIAEALGCTLHVSVVRKTPPELKQKATLPRVARSQK